jgi:hypothetical protein
MGWSIFWATFSQTHLVTLPAAQLTMCVAGKPIKISEIFVSKEILALKSHQALA